MIVKDIQFTAQIYNYFNLEKNLLTFCVNPINRGIKNRQLPYLPRRVHRA